MTTTRNLLVAAALSATAVFSFAQAPQTQTTSKPAVATATATTPAATPAATKTPAPRHAAASHHAKHQARHHKAAVTKVQASPARSSQVPAVTASPAIK